MKIVIFTMNILYFTLLYHFLAVKKFIFPQKHIAFGQKTIDFAVFLKKNAQWELLKAQFEVSHKVPVENFAKNVIFFLRPI
jgi:hypothetical protein